MGEARIETLDGAVARLAVRRGSWLVGRGPDADLRLHTGQVSLRHAWIRRDARGTWVSDAGSRTGTRLNGRRLAAGQDHPLRPGDRLEFGPVTAVYSDGTSAVAPARTWQRPPAGDVLAGMIGGAGPDVDHGCDVRIAEPATGRGAGRAVLVLGLLTALAGFAIGMAVIFRFAKAVAGGFEPPSVLGPAVFGGVPLGAVAFAVVGLGGAVATIGLVLAKAARRRRR